MILVPTLTKFLPVIIFFGAPLSIITTYGIAIGNGHVYPLWPYISDTGAKPPESCIFSFCLCSASFLLFFVAYVRYREVGEYLNLNPSIKIKPIFNTISLVFGGLSALGLLIVACFQEVHEFTTHISGALMCFCSTIIYFFFQTVFTRRLRPNSKALLWIRITLTFWSCVFVVGSFAPLHCALSQFKGENPLQWKEKDGGYEYHLVSTICEWLMTSCFVCFICTLFWDFRKFDLNPPTIKFINQEGV